jgi:hypothetical protein
MRVSLRRAALALALAAPLVPSLYAQQAAVSLQTASGLRVANFTTPPGRVSVLLPQELAAGDRVSGTIRLTPNGADAAARQRNLAELERYNVQVGGRTIQAGARRFTTDIPAGGQSTEVALGGTDLPRVSGAIPVERTIPAPARYRLPSIGQARLPLQIEGAFDGDSATTAVGLGNTPVNILAESPRRIVAESPDGVIGQSELSVSEAGRTVRGAFRNIALELSSPRTRLRRSEQTTVTATVRGLANLKEPLELSLNLTTSNVSMSGGNQQTIRIAPSDVAEGTFTITRTLTAAAEGGFSVSAVLPVAGVPSATADSGPPAIADATPPAPTPAAIPKPANSSETPATPTPPLSTIPIDAPLASNPVADSVANGEQPRAAEATTTTATSGSTQMPVGVGMLGGLALLGVLGGLLAAGANAAGGPALEKPEPQDAGTDPTDTRPEHERWHEEIDHAGLDEVLRKYDNPDPSDVDLPDASGVEASPPEDPRDATGPEDEPHNYFPEDADDLAAFNEWLNESGMGQPDSGDPRDAEPPLTSATAEPDARDADVEEDEPRNYFPEDAEDLEAFGKWLEENGMAQPDEGDPRDAPDLPPSVGAVPKAPTDEDPRDHPVDWSDLTRTDVTCGGSAPPPLFPPAPRGARPPRPPVEDPRDHPSDDPHDDPRDQPATEEELRAMIAELEQRKKDFEEALSQYNDANEDLRHRQNQVRAYQEYLSGKIDELHELLTHWDPKKAPPKIERILNRVIDRDPHAPVGPTAHDVRDTDQGYTRLMTRREVEQELERLRAELAQSGHRLDDLQDRWNSAWERLKQTGELVARGWEDLESALNNQNCHHAPRDWSTPGPGGVQINGDGFATGWWMPPTITLPEKKTADDPHDQPNPWIDLLRNTEVTCGGSAPPPFKLFEDPTPPRGGANVLHSGGVGFVNDADDGHEPPAGDGVGGRAELDETDDAQVSTELDEKWLQEADARWMAQYGGGERREPSEPGTSEQGETDAGDRPITTRDEASDPVQGETGDAEVSTELDENWIQEADARWAEQYGATGDDDTARDSIEQDTEAEAEPPPLSEDARRAIERMVNWALSVPGVTSIEHPLVHLLLALAAQMGAEQAEALTGEMFAGDPLTALVNVLRRVAERANTSADAAQARLILTQILDTLLSDPSQQTAWNVADADRARVTAARDAALSAFVDEALRAGTLDLLATAFTMLARPPAMGGRPDDPRIAQLRQALEAIVRELDAVEDAEPLGAIRAGTLSIEDLEALATDALERGKLPLFVEASLALIDKRSRFRTAAEVEELERFGTEALELAKQNVLAFPQEMAAGMLQAALQAERPFSPADVVGQLLALVELLRSLGATDLLATLPARFEAMFGARLDEALRAAMEETGRLGAAVQSAREGDESALEAIVEQAGRVAARMATPGLDTAAAAAEILQQSVERVRELARYRLMLQTATLDGEARRRALDEQLTRTNAELAAFETGLGRYADGTASMRGRASGRREALRAARDAAEDLILGDDPAAAQAALDRIFEQLNGTWHHARLDHPRNFRENGIRQKLDAALQEDDDSPEVRRLLDEMQYFERRRIQILFLNPSWSALEQYERIKHSEELYWRSRQRWDELKWLGETEADRVLLDVGQYRTRDLPALLSELGRALEDPQGFIRYLARLRGEDVRRGAQAWAAYYATPWQKRGLVVQTWRLIHVDEIQREMHQDRLFAQALAQAAEMPAAQLRRDNPQAYRRLEQAGFIRNGEYVIPEAFTYSAETTGSRMSQRHWSDELLNVESFSVMAATILLPGAGAARLVTGLREAYAVASGFRAAALPLARLALAEGTLFTIFSGIARGALHGVPLSSGVSPEHLVRELGLNIVTLGGLSLMNRIAKPLEEALLKQQLLARALSKPVQQLTRPEIAQILKKAGFEGGKISTEALGFTALGLVPGLGGKFDAETFFHNLVFISQLRAANVIASLGPKPRPATAGSGPRPVIDRGSAPERASQPGDILEPGGRKRQVATPEVARRFLNWYSSTMRTLGINSSARLRDRLIQELTEIVRDPNAPAARKQSARVLRSLLKNRTVEIVFENEGAAHGGYDPVKRRARVFVAELAKSLFVRSMRRGQLPTVREFVNALLGTTAHEGMAHGLQGTDARTWADGQPVTERHRHEADGAGGRTRPYSELHEIEAFLEQRQFDPTLNGRDPQGASRTDAEALQRIIEIVNENYTDEQIQRRNERTLEEMDPQGYAEWLKIRDSLSGPEARGRLAELFFQHVYDRRTPVADRVARAVERLRNMQRGATRGAPDDAMSRSGESDADPAATRSGDPPRRRKNPDLNRGGTRRALSPEDTSNARPGRMYDEREYARRPGEMGPSIQEGPQCAPTSIADAMRAHGRQVTARDVIEAGHRAAANDPRLKPPNAEGWMTRETRAAAARELGFEAEDVSFRTIEELQQLLASGEVVVSVRTVRGGAHAMRVVTVEPSPPSIRNAADPTRRTLGTIRLADTNPTGVPGQGGGRIVELPYEEFFQQTKQGDTESDAYGMLIRPARPRGEPLGQSARSRGVPGRRQGAGAEDGPARNDGGGRADTQSEARLGRRLRDLVDRLKGRTGEPSPALTDPLEGLPQPYIDYWRSRRTPETTVEFVEAALAEVAAVIRRHRAAGVPDKAVRRALDWVAAHRGLTSSLVEALERMLFLEGAAATGATIVVSPESLAEFDAFAAGADVNFEMFDLKRLDDIRAKVAQQVASGRPQLTRADLEFIEQRIFRLGLARARTMFGFERAIGDLERAELFPLFPDSFIQDLRTLYHGGRPPVVDRPATAAVPSARRPPAPLQGAQGTQAPLELFRQLPRDVQKRLLKEVSPVAVGFDLRSWRQAVRNDPAGEQALLDVLRTAGVGNPGGARSVAEEIEARFRSVPRPPAGLDVQALRLEFEAAADAWRRAPLDASAALRWLKLRVLLGGIAPRSSAAPFASASIRPGDGISAAEAAQLLVADAAQLAATGGDARLAASQLARLAAMAEAMGAPVGLDAPRRLLAERDLQGFWRAFVDVRRQVVASVLREVLL